MSYTVNEPEEEKAWPPRRRIPALCIGTVVMTVLCVSLTLATVLVKQHKYYLVQAKWFEDGDVGASALAGETTTTTTINGKTTAAITPTTPTVEKDESTEVQLDCFMVRGLRSAGAFVFKGMPYAEPPVGPLRWQPPVPLTVGQSEKCRASNDNDTVDATRFGEMCFQTSASNSTPFEGSEDCLFLNVWTPTLNTSGNLPVIVYIHGGSLVSLSGNTPTISPHEHIAVSGNVVFVSMNYRLNVFGFLALDILSQASPTNTSGNYGLMDQILALEWVKKNIAKFGGNPSQVTVFGHSSGATSLFALLASPAADGLYHRAWLASGSVSLNATLEEASAANLHLLNNTGCATLTCLYQLTPEQLMKAIPRDRWEGDNLDELPVKGRFNDPLVIADGVFLPSPPLQAWRDNTSRITVPVLVGTTAQEVDMFAFPSGIKSWNWTDYTENVRQRLDTFRVNISQEALRLYPAGNESDPEYQYTSMVSDQRVTCPTRKQADVMAMASSAPVFRYVVTSWPSKEISPFGMPTTAAYAFHGLEVFAFFGVLGLYIYPLSEADIDFQNTIQSEVFNFVRTGNVRSAFWLPFPNTTAILDRNTTVVDDYHKEQCDFWENNGFLSYAWIN